MTAARLRDVVVLDRANLSINEQRAAVDCFVRRDDDLGSGSGPPTDRNRRGVRWIRLPVVRKLSIVPSHSAFCCRDNEIPPSIRTTWRDADRRVGEPNRRHAPEPGVAWREDE